MKVKKLNNTSYQIHDESTDTTIYLTQEVIDRQKVKNYIYFVDAFADHFTNGEEMEVFDESFIAVEYIINNYLGSQNFTRGKSSTFMKKFKFYEDGKLIS